MIVEVIRSMGGLAAELINLCHLQTGAKVLNTARSTKLTQLVNERSMILIPLQESLTANLPPSSAAENTHQPFPTNPPTFVSEWLMSSPVLTIAHYPKSFMMTFT